MVPVAQNPWWSVKSPAYISLVSPVNLCLLDYLVVLKPLSVRSCLIFSFSLPEKSFGKFIASQHVLTVSHYRLFVVWNVGRYELNSGRGSLWNGPG